MLEFSLLNYAGRTTDVGGEKAKDLVHIKIVGGGEKLAVWVYRNRDGDIVVDCDACNHEEVVVFGKQGVSVKRGG